MPRLKRKMPLIYIVWTVAFLLLSRTVALSRPEDTFSCNTALIKKARVVKVDDRGILHLQDGDRVHLAGILPVKFYRHATSPMARKLNRLARQATRLIRREVEGRQVELHRSGRQRDRYDRLLAHVYGENGNWLQGLLLRAGLARSLSFADSHACMRQMLALEAKARQQRRGLWDFALFTPLSAQQTRELMRKRYRFALVEGRVNKVARVKKWLFLNFGRDWHDDFTIAIRRKYIRTIERSGLDLQGLAGRRVRVRGWIERWNGPLIKVTHRQQIEVLDE